MKMQRSTTRKKNGSVVCLSLTFLAVFILIFLNMVIMNYRVNALAPIESIIHLPVSKEECCSDHKLAVCISCSMGKSITTICKDFPTLTDCPDKSQKNLRQSKEIPLDATFASLDEFEQYILNSVTKEQLIKGSFDDITDSKILEFSDRYGDKYKELSRNAMKFSYSNYEKYAFGHDELKPTSGSYTDRWGGNGVTLIDALDTLWIMGFKDEFYRGQHWIEKNLHFDHNKYVSFFETTIRDLGGLLSAYYLSNEKIFLDKAEELGRKLFVTFQHNDLPKGEVNLVTGGTKTATWLGGGVLLAEVGTCQLEFGALGKLVKDDEIYELPKQAVVKVEEEYDSISNLFPIILGKRGSSKHITAEGKKKGSGKITFGGAGDSYYEYLLKFWVQSNFKETKFRGWYEESIQGMVDHLVFETKPNKLTMLATASYPTLRQTHEMDHLACFVPGMLALGVHHAPEGYLHKERDLTLAKKLMFSCVEFYLKNPTGLSPEIVVADDQVDLKPKGKDKFYLLRPEMVESLYILHSVTRHPIYRIWGKLVMENIEKYCRTTYGYGSYPDVTKTVPPKDEMESFFLAETLKYHYLLQTDETEINIDEWVFNTEAHPLKIFPK